MCTGKGGRAGFTLIELVITVAIIGVVAAISIPNVLHTYDSAKKRADGLAAVSISNAVMEAYLDGAVSETKDNIFVIPAAHGDAIEPYLANASSLTPQSATDAVFEVTVLAEGKCTVTLKKKSGNIIARLYPIPDAGYR